METTSTPIKTLRARHGTTTSYRPDTATLERLDRIAEKITETLGLKPSSNVILRRATQLFEEYLNSTDPDQGIYVFEPGYEKQRLLLSAEGWEVQMPTHMKTTTTNTTTIEGDF